jgi:hypothetical protein
MEHCALSKRKPKNRPTKRRAFTLEHVRAATEFMRWLVTLLLLLSTFSAAPVVSTKQPVDTIETGSVVLK